MPAQVVVVKRPRRRAFAILRAAPAWVRAFFRTMRLGRRTRTTLDLPGPSASTVSSGASTAATGRASGVLLPRVVSGSKLDGCSVCLRCVELCPAHALGFSEDAAAPFANGHATAADTDPVHPIRFEVDPGRCFGCTDCARACPDELLEMAPAISRIGFGAIPPRVNLLSGVDWAVEE